MSRMEEDRDSSMLQLSAGDIELPTFTDYSTITIQPSIGGEFPGSRRPIPVSTIDWRSTNLTQFTPMHGLDFLNGVEQLYIQQTVELNDLLANVESENRYSVKVPQGETLFLACETSTAMQRMIYDSRRAFSMRLYDQTRQEAMSFVRKLAFSNFCCGCYLQELQIWIPPGELLGAVQQNWTFSNPSFTVLDSHKQVLYVVEGPNMCNCSLKTDANFKIYSPDTYTHMGNIHYQWDQLLVAYNLRLNFPSRNTTCKEKALLLGAAFLLEYLYFEPVKKSSWCKFPCAYC